MIIRLEPRHGLDRMPLATPWLAMPTAGLQFLALVRLGFRAAGWKRTEIATLLDIRKQGVI